MTAQRPMPTDASAVMRPWTPDALAARWGCSGETVRQMCADGRQIEWRT